jgi:mRNA-degrading endonuclease toxin of MazEF toxin-antitoxin module
MKFHVSSFIIGMAAGAAYVGMGKRAHPIVMELAAAGYRLADGLAAQAAVRMEDWQDMLAEAKARARARESEEVGEKWQ